MQVGYNHNVKHKGREFHIQTEDSGKSSTTITTLLYCEGTIIASKKANYSKIASEYDNYESQLKELMQKQHKKMLINLKNGDFDDPELEDMTEPEEVKEEEDKTIADAISSTDTEEPAEDADNPPEEMKAEEWKKDAAAEDAPAAGEESPAAAEESPGLDKKTSDFVSEIINSLTKALLSLAQKEVEITKEKEEASTLEKLSAFYDENIVISQSKISGDVDAECAFICDVKTATTIADLLLLGEGTPKDEMTDDDLDAIKETANQAFRSSIQQISDAFGLKIFFDPVKATTINATEKKDELAKLFSDVNIFAFDYQIKLGGVLDAKLHFYLTSGIKSGLAAKKDAIPAEEGTTIMQDEDASVMKAEDEVEVFGPFIGDDSDDLEERELRNINLIKGIEVDVKIKLGETVMPLKKIVKLAPGTIIELNKDVESLLDLVVNDKTIAQGVLVVVSSNNFAIRLTTILDKADRIKKIGGGVEDY